MCQTLIRAEKKDPLLGALDLAAKIFDVIARQVFSRIFATLYSCHLRTWNAW